MPKKTCPKHCNEPSQAKSASKIQTPTRPGPAVLRTPQASATRLAPVRLTWGRRRESRDRAKLGSCDLRGDVVDGAPPSKPTPPARHRREPRRVVDGVGEALGLYRERARTVWDVKRGARSAKCRLIKDDPQSRILLRSVVQIGRSDPFCAASVVRALGRLQRALREEQLLAAAWHTKEQN